MVAKTGVVRGLVVAVSTHGRRVKRSACWWLDGRLGLSFSRVVYGEHSEAGCSGLVVSVSAHLEWLILSRVIKCM